MTALTRFSLFEYPAGRILLIKPSALGDIIHSLPVLTALRQRYRGAHITWLVNRSYEQLLHGHPDLDATLAFDRRSCQRSPWSFVQIHAGFLQTLRTQRFDLVIDLQGLLRSGLFALASRAPRRVGLDSAREGSRWCYTDIIAGADRKRVHAVDRYWLVAEALGVGAGPKIFHVPIPPEARAWAQEILHRSPRPWLVLGVGARWKTKRWPPQHFAELARRAQASFGGTVIFVGGREEAPLAQVTASGLAGPVRDLTGRTSLPQLSALLSLADVMAANDTGPLHLAAALGRPVVAPYTCTRAVLTGPYGAANKVVATRVWCAGSYRKHCRRLECLSELTPDRLWPVLHGILQQWESNSRSA
jgi:lipopolysaccharide heptosyltransferase I